SSRRSRQQRGRSEEQPGQDRRAESAAEDADLRLLELQPAERERRDEERDGEADPGDRPGAGDRGPPDWWLQPAAARPGEQPGAAEDGDRLADDVSDQHAERDRRREGLPEKPGVDRD